MNRFFTSLFVLAGIISSQVANAQISLSTDCSNQYLVSAIQLVDDGELVNASFTYDNDRHLTSLTQGEDDEYMTINVTWTSTAITYNFFGYDFVTATLDENGNAKSMTNLYGESVTYNYENGYLVSYTANTEYGNEYGQIKWKDGNPVEVKITDDDNWTQTYTFTYSNNPNNTNLDFGILQCTEVTSFALPLGKGIKNLPIHAEEFYGNNVSEIVDFTYEFDSQNRPIKMIQAGTDYEDNRTNDFSETVIISYDERFVPLSITKPHLEPSDDSQTYNLLGQKVYGSQKGIVIRGGKKVIN